MSRSHEHTHVTLSDRRKLAVWSALVISLLVLSGLGASLLARGQLPVDDFVEYWAAGRLNLAGDNPYAAEQIVRLERVAGRTAEPLMMWNPPYMLALSMPLGLFDYPLSRLLWLVLNVALILASAGWLWELFDGPKEKRWVAVAVSVTFFPALIVLRMGQIAPFLLFGLVGFMRFERKGRYWTAGFCVALLAIKPHLVYLVLIVIAVWSLRRKRWGVLGGAALVVSWATLMSVAANPQVLIRYVRANAESSPLIWMTPTLGSLLRLLFGVEMRWLQFIPVLPGLVWLAIYGVRHRGEWDWVERMPLLLLVSVMTAPFGWSFDQVVLVPIVLGVVCPLMIQRWSRATTAIVASYLVINACAWALYGHTSDLWQVWLAPVLLLWYSLSRRWLERAIETSKPTPI